MSTAGFTPAAPTPRDHSDKRCNATNAAGSPAGVTRPPPGERGDGETESIRDALRFFTTYNSNHSVSAPCTARSRWEKRQKEEEQIKQEKSNDEPRRRASDRCHRTVDVFLTALRPSLFTRAYRAKILNSPKSIRPLLFLSAPESLR